MNTWLIDFRKGSLSQPRYEIGSWTILQNHHHNWLYIIHIRNKPIWPKNTNGISSMKACSRLPTLHWRPAEPTCRNKNKQTPHIHCGDIYMRRFRDISVASFHYHNNRDIIQYIYWSKQKMKWSKHMEATEMSDTFKCEIFMIITVYSWELIAPSYRCRLLKCWSTWQGAAKV